MVGTKSWRRARMSAARHLIPDSGGTPVSISASVGTTLGLQSWWPHVRAFQFGDVRAGGG